jgi:predicted phage tail protein
MGSQSTPKEAENDLISVSKLKILDLISEGEIAGFWPKF